MGVSTDTAQNDNAAKNASPVANTAPNTLTPNRVGAVGDNFICTSMKTGLLPCHIERARQILNSGN